MIWLTWRQLRTQAAVVFGALVALTILLLITGFQVRNWYDANGIAACAAAQDCQSQVLLSEPYQWLQVLSGRFLMLVVPVVISMFWGAPLIAHELETGSYRLAFTQSVTRTRWLTAKVTVVGVASVAVSGLLSWIVTWWYAPFDAINANMFDPTIFSERDVVPIGYAAFGFALGLVAGLLIRKTLPAMATTLVGYVIARLVVTYWVRPYFATPVTVTAALQSPGRGAIKLVGAPPGAWLMHAQILDSAGQATTRRAPGTSLASYHRVVTYQPASDGAHLNLPSSAH